MTVIDTDYREYAVLYSCTNSILPRDGVLSNPSRQNIYTKLDSHKINRNQLHLSDRFGCPAVNVTGPAREEPEIAPLTPVPLPNLIKTSGKPTGIAAGQPVPVSINLLAQSAPAQPILAQSVPIQTGLVAQPIVARPSSIGFATAATLVSSPVAQPAENNVSKDETVALNTVNASS